MEGAKVKVRATTLREGQKCAALDGWMEGRKEADRPECRYENVGGGRARGGGD